jgi:hypothetical protein
MKTPVAICCVLMLASCPVGMAAGRLGDAEVRAGSNGEPCFTISEREERRAGTPDFDAVTVTEVAGRRALMWRMAMPVERTFPITFSMCVPYAGRVTALPQTPAGKLEAGMVYHVRIDTRRAKGQAGAPAYEARFCLARQPDGTLLVHHIGRDDHEGRRMYGCAAPGD